MHRIHPAELLAGYDLQKHQQAHFIHRLGERMQYLHDTQVTITCSSSCVHLYRNELCSNKRLQSQHSNANTQAACTVAAASYAADTADILAYAYPAWVVMACQGMGSLASAASGSHAGLAYQGRGQGRGQACPCAVGVACLVEAVVRWLAAGEGRQREGVAAGEDHQQTNHGWKYQEGPHD